MLALKYIFWVLANLDIIKTKLFVFYEFRMLDFLMVIIGVLRVLVDLVQDPELYIGYLCASYIYLSYLGSITIGKLTSRLVWPETIWRITHMFKTRFNHLFVTPNPYIQATEDLQTRKIWRLNGWLYLVITNKDVETHSKDVLTLYHT